MFPGPLVEAMGCDRGTSTGDTNTDSFAPSEDTMAVPKSLIVDFIILAYSKSTFVRVDIPWQETCHREVAVTAPQRK